MRPLAILPIVLLVALAGCADDAGDAGPAPGSGGGSSDASGSSGSGGDGDVLPVAVVTVDYGDIRPGDEPSRDEVAYDPDARPSRERYDETGTPRPDGYTVHDLLVDWSGQSGVPVTVEHHAAHGFRVTAIDGVTENTTPGGRWYWALHVDGQPVTAAMGTVVVEEDADYGWVFTHATD